MSNVEDPKAKAIETLSSLFATNVIGTEQFESAVALLNRAIDAAELERSIDTLSQVVPGFARAMIPSQGIPVPRRGAIEYIDCNMSTIKKKGDWVRSNSYEVHVRAGTLKLDFREYETAKDFYLEIDAEVSMGTFKIVVPEDFEVQDDFQSIRTSSVSNRPKSGSMGTGKILVRGSLSASSFVVKYK